MCNSSDTRTASPEAQGLSFSPETVNAAIRRRNLRRAIRRRLATLGMESVQTSSLTLAELKSVAIAIAIVKL